MAKKKKLQLPAKLQPWLEARQKYRLTDTQIQMARELGLNPRKFGGYANHRQEPWKSPLGEYIEYLYTKRFKKEQPDRVTSLEEQAQEIQRKREEKKARKRARQTEEGNRSE
ncbi:MAG: hypothetical protein DPW09_03105 [Anaerolineae bacterium]|nr:hypothetical protein [Anaerolineae bacterium]